jgi:hypothetical protein
MIIEKAYAKLFGGYGLIETGIAKEVLRDFTGAPAITIFTL